MDNIPDEAFIRLFDRFTSWVSMRGAYDEESINKRINRVLRVLRRGSKNAKRESTQRNFANNMRRMRHLKRIGMAERIVREAVYDENSIYALSMKYGYNRARKIKLEQSKKNVRKL